jgi:hypothetical protein
MVAHECLWPWQIGWHSSATGDDHVEVACWSSLIALLWASCFKRLVLEGVSLLLLWQVWVLSDSSDERNITPMPLPFLRACKPAAQHVVPFDGYHLAASHDGALSWILHEKDGDCLVWCPVPSWTGGCSRARRVRYKRLTTFSGLQIYHRSKHRCNTKASTGSRIVQTIKAHSAGHRNPHRSNIVQA